MMIHWSILLITFLFVNIHAQVNQTQYLTLAVAEHKSNDIIQNNPLDQSPEKILVRVPRTDRYFEELTGNVRQRRYTRTGEQIWGMAKAVAITVFVLIAVSLLCCIVTTLYICKRCCCDGNGNRKRQQGFNPIQQPIIIHTNSPNSYQPQYHQQQAPTSAPVPVPVSVPTWRLENHPMLPQPSAPPRPNDDSYIDRPPAYEKICAN